jgi:DNA-binding transcriptional LysR family regulator
MLTPAGEVLAAAARRALAEVGLGLDYARRAGAGEAGSLVVGVASTALLTDLPRAFRAYQARFPDVDFRLREMHSSAQLEALRAGSIDVGIMREVPADETSLVSERLVREGFVGVIPASHALAGRASIAAAALAEEPLILFSRAVAPGLYDQILELCRTAGFTPRLTHQMDEWHTISACVREGLGVSIAPMSVRRLQSPGVAYPSLRGSQQRAELHACWRRDAAPPVWAFLESVRSVRPSPSLASGGAARVRPA